jgi:hypothetical protein
MDQIDLFIHGQPCLLERNTSHANDFLSRELFAPRLINSSGLVVSETERHDSSQLTHEKIFLQLSSLGMKRVCQYQFKKNDIVWICRQCEADETCVLCNDCFQGSNHQGHEVYFYHSTTGGCCDCGDPCAWKPEGFCHRHGRSTQDPLLGFPGDIHESATRVVSKLVHGIVAFWERFQFHW